MAKIIFVLIHWAQQISAGPWYVRMALLSICSAHKEQLAAKTALKFFRKCHYLLIFSNYSKIFHFIVEVEAEYEVVLRIS